MVGVPSRLALLAFVGSCSTPPVAAYDCACTYLTDTDVPGEQRTAVCVDQGRDPAGAASECVQGMGVGSVERCTCHPSERTCELAKCAPLE